MTARSRSCSIATGSSETSHRASRQGPRDDVRDPGQLVARLINRLGGQEDAEGVGVGVDPEDRAGRAPVAVGPRPEEVAVLRRGARPAQAPGETPGMAAALPPMIAPPGVTLPPPPNIPLPQAEPPPAAPVHREKERPKPIVLKGSIDDETANLAGQQPEVVERHKAGHLLAEDGPRGPVLGLIGGHLR